MYKLVRDLADDGGVLEQYRRSRNGNLFFCEYGGISYELSVNDTSLGVLRRVQWAFLDGKEFRE